MNAPLFSNPTDSSTPTTQPRRFNPWCMFIGSMIPNWLQCRKEIGQGPKLAYARLAQYAGENGECFPKQATLAAELGVSERMANEYIRTLIRFKLIEKERFGLGKPNRYYFLAHPWIDERSPETRLRSDYRVQSTSGPKQKNSSGQKRQQTSAPNNKEIHKEEIQDKRLFPHNPPKGECEKNIVSPSSSEEQIYAAYPRKIGKPPAIRAIRRALLKHAFDFLLDRTQLFAKTCNSPPEFIPHPSTWFNEERFNDDPSTWRRAVDAGAKSHPAIIRAEKFGCDVSKL